MSKINFEDFLLFYLRKRIKNEVLDVIESMRHIRSIKTSVRIHIDISRVHFEKNRTIMHQIKHYTTLATSSPIIVHLKRYNNNSPAGLKKQQAPQSFRSISSKQNSVRVAPLRKCQYSASFTPADSPQYFHSANESKTVECSILQCTTITINFICS